MQTPLSDLLEQIDDAVEAEDNSKALQLILNNWEKLPDPAPLRERTGLVLATAGRKREAVEIYRLVARHYANAGFPTRALATIKQIQNLNPSSTQLLDHFTTLYSVRSPFLERDLRQSEVPEPTQSLDLETESTDDTDELFSRAIEVANDKQGTAERPGALPALPLLSRLPPGALRRLLDFVEYEIYAEVQPILGPDQTEHDLFWAVGSDLLAADGDETFRIPAGALLGLNTIADDTANSKHSVVSQKGSEVLRLSRRAVDGLSEEFPDFPNRLATLHRHALTEAVFQRHPIFTDLEAQVLEELPDQVVGLKLESETVFVRQGKISPGLFIVIDGTVDILRNEDDQEWSIETLSPGDIAGEIGLINPRPSVTTAVTRSDGHVLFFSREDFIHFADQHPSVARATEHQAEQRVEVIREAISAHRLEKAD